ncbi:IcmF-related protein [Enhygromyxa salina]|uniref:IcmF-related protein n=1 Tax=Enhygromyxa salina TaxID=215803 RepID=A0A0C2CZN9_9BACT|nr:type VI secretion system membrane subunit TssM [Enhygromyxa salina]KIG13332.1 IcmF-related protein [Enhygromyxa salina]
MLKYIFASLLILVVWGLWWFLKLPIWVAVLATVIIILVVVAIVVVGILKARRAANKIEKALASQGAAQAAGARPDMQADINAMSSEFNKAVGALKGSRLGKEALYALPWYVIIGPPGVGKSTALRNSGLQFPYLSEKGGGAVKGIGGTRNCDWWMTNQAVIVDTAGRYTTEDTDRDEWIAFLDLLKDTRPKRPINGILLAVSVADLALAAEGEINTMATKIRARIDEVTKHLEMSVPVYVLFTKCDLLPGFVEMYSEMGKSERKSIWGFTLPVTGAYAGVDPTGTFCDQFDRLADRTEQRSLRRMGDDRRVESRGKIYEFPQHFELLRDNLASFIGLVFTGNVYAETPMLRGCYFTSGTQEGRPIDRLMGSMAQAFGMQSALAGQPQVEARSYFLGNLFNKVIFADRELARRSTKHVRKAAIIKWAGAGGIFATAVGFCVLPVRSMKANQQVLATVSGAVDKVGDEEADAGAPIPNVDRLYPLYEAQAELYGYEHDSRPFKLRWGMYQANELQEPTRSLFGRSVREELIVPIMKDKQLELTNFAARYPGDEDEPPADESGKAHDMLRAYLLLANDFSEYKPDLLPEQLGLERNRENTWLGHQIALWWAEGMLVDTESETFRKMETVASTYVTVLREQNELELEIDEAMVESVRKVLRRSDRTETWLAELIAEASNVDGVKDITLATLKLGTNVYKNDGVKVRGAFTRFGWEKYCRIELAKDQGEFVGSEWVLGLTDKEAKERRMTDRLRLRSRYMDQYIKEWDQFVAKIYVDASSDLVGSLKMFQDLARGGTPLRVLLNHVAWHTDLKEEEREAGTVPWYHPDQLPKDVRAKVEATTPEGTKAFYANKDVKDYFAPFVGFGVDVSTPAEGPDGPPAVAGALQIDVYAEQLTAVRDALQAAVDDRAELDALAKKLRTTTQAVKGQISEQQEPWRNRYDRILRPPFDAVRGVVEGGQAAGTGASWCAAVYLPFDGEVAGKYPFNPKGYDLPIGEFAKWFAPDQGPIWEFYNASLASRIQKSGNAFTMVDGGAAMTTSYNTQVPPFLTQVGDIGAVMFPPGSATPKFEFEIQIDGTPGVSEISLEVDGQKVTYRNGPQSWKPMTWPGTEGAPGASIKAKGLGKTGDVLRKGDWGFWHLLEEATVSGAAGQQVYSIKWDLSDQQVGIVTIRLRPKRAETPLFGVPSRGSGKYMGLFSSLKVPKSIISGYSCSAGPAEGEGDK